LLKNPKAVGFLFADKVYQSKLINCRVHHAGLVGFMFIRDVNETLMQQCTAEYCQQSGVFLADLKLPEHIAPMDFEAQLHHTDHVIGNFGPFAVDDLSPYRTDMIDFDMIIFNPCISCIIQAYPRQFGLRTTIVHQSHFTDKIYPQLNFMLHTPPTIIINMFFHITVKWVLPRMVLLI
jgi:hypothetical protein